MSSLDLHWLEQLPPEALKALLAAADQHLAYGRIEDYYPDTGPLRRELYPKHTAFFAAGANNRIRSMIAANRIGKTEGVGGYELSLHMTGDYPAWWTGKRFDRATRWWAAGDTNKTVREILQYKLLGQWDDFGSGLIPKDRLADWTRKSGVPETVDSFQTHHASGGISRCVLLSYEAGRKAFQGTEQDGILLDEEPPLDIFTECLLRTMTTDGLILNTFTPLSGMTRLIKHLREIGSWEIQVTWDDVPHLSTKQKDELWRDTPEHEREARAKGIPSRGSGVVFTVSEESILIDAFPIPKHWARIAGIDPGWDHYSAGVQLAHDRDEDIIYAVACFREKQCPPLKFAERVRPWGEWLPWAWPHDAKASSGKFDGKDNAQLAEIYRGHRLNFLPERATFDDGTAGVEAGVIGILEYMQAGRFKVFRHLTDLRQEIREYHRKDGVIVKEDDDLVSAMRYAWMMRRSAVLPPSGRRGFKEKPNWRTI